MKKSLSSCLFCILLTIVCNYQIFSAPVNREKAEKVLLQFIKNLPIDKAGSNNIIQVYPDSKLKLNSISSLDLSDDFYVYNLNKSAFVIISAEDKTKPILAYSVESNFNLDNASPQLKWWLEEMKQSISKVKANDKISLNPEWQNILLKNKNNNLAEINLVNPLLQTKWNQAPYYNDKCPLDPKLNQRAVTGCVATAMAQVMKYWNYPTKGSSFHQYNHNYFGTLFANFSNTTYDWASMANRVTSTNDAVATLMLHCGIAVDMDYSVESSGSEGASLVAPALINYFGYSSNTKAVDRDKYSFQNWVDLLKAELTSSRPIYYQGIGSGGGHAFVLDGFDNNGLFHVNWGWDGQSDGYFALSALNPDALGTGGGDGGFNSNQTAVVGVEAPTSKGSKLQLDAEIIVTPIPVKFAEPFYITTNIINSGNSIFKGSLAAALFTTKGVFVTFIDTVIENGLPIGFNYGVNGITFATNGIASASPGDYIVAIFQKEENGKWKIIDDGKGTNIVSITIEGPYNTISLFAEMIPSIKYIEKGKDFSISTDFANLSNADFNGEITLDLYNLDGTWISQIASKNDITLESVSHFTNGLIFQVSGLNLEAGEYLIAAWSKPKTDTNYTLISPSSFKNPISIIVSATPIAQDVLEPNNTKATATQINLSVNSNDVFSPPLMKDNLNIHISKDVDFFNIQFPNIKTYDYYIKAIVYDINNPNGTAKYDLDAAISYELNGIPSDTVYDDVTNAIKVKAGDILNYKVSPLFQGLLGNYAISFQIMRKVSTGIEDEIPYLMIYPNPATEVVCFDNNNNFENIELIDILGNLKRKLNVTTNDKNICINISGLTNGIYFIQSNNKILNKFIIAK